MRLRPLAPLTLLFATLPAPGCGQPATTPNGPTPSGTAPPGEPFTVLHRFSGPDGCISFGALTKHENRLYGNTYKGGTRGQGVLFAYDLPGGPYTVLHSFDGAATGSEPFSDLWVEDGRVYGVAKMGGKHGGGTLFKVGTDGRGFTVLHHFTSEGPADATGPHAGPTLVSGQLYGTTFHGGPDGSRGCVYSYDLAAGRFSVIHTFDAKGGSHPTGRPVFHRGWLYGFASDYERDAEGAFGTIYRLRTDGAGFEVLYRFEDGDHGHPYDKPVFLPDGRLVGTGHGRFGRAGSPGGVFAFHPDTREFRWLHQFKADGSAGMKPNGAPAHDPKTGMLYVLPHGTSGGEAADGSLIQVGTSGGRFQCLRLFNDQATGLMPTRTPVLDAGVVYGTTSFGGTVIPGDAPQGAGVIFAYRVPPIP